MEEEIHNKYTIFKNKIIQKEKVLYTQEVFYTHFNLVPHGCQDKDKMAAVPAASATWLPQTAFTLPRPKTLENNDGQVPKS